MLAASVVLRRNAKSNVEESFRRFGKNLPPNEAIARLARAIWPVKTDLELSIRTGTSDRACRELLSQRGGMSLNAFVSLLSSEEGLDFLFAVLGDASPEWRRKLEYHIDISLERHALEEQRRRIAELESRAGWEFTAPKKPRKRLPLPKRT